MARTAATATGTFVGACVRCGATYFAASRAEQGLCACRAGVVCEDARCLLQTEGAHDHAVTAVKWQAVVGRVSTHVCDAACLTAQGNKCTCSCGGTNHGYGLARFERGLAPRAA